MRTLVASLILLAFSRGDALPPLIAGNLTLWAWERPDDLRWLAGSGVGVALLERTVAIRAGRVDVERRRQPLRVAPDTRLTAVVRVETDHNATDLALVPRVATEIADAARMPRATAVQIDFDARLSERPFYSALPREVRVRPPLRVSMTALASWCTDDPWIEAGVVDEIVPMLFQMGPDAPRIITRLQEDRRWPVNACVSAQGLSTDEPWRRLPAASTTYIWRGPDAITARSVGALARHGG
ncbi:MAG: hypothetical protein JJE40_18935 [Vicinamibacteria bacterium]|nr:hypothetical protein [Vicinamibacteria bacterium]